MELFLGRSDRSKATAETLLAKLRQIEACFASQTAYQIYSSSLLLIHEGSPGSNHASSSARLIGRRRGLPSKRGRPDDRLCSHWAGAQAG